MRKTQKFAISLPKEDFEKIEKIRKRLGFERSALIDKAIRFWLKNLEQEELIRRYEEGYKKQPEDIVEIIAMENAAIEAFKEEGLK